MVKAVENGYIIAISETATDGIEITQKEYDTILSAIHNRPEQKDGFALMLKDGTLEWEYLELPEPADENAEISDYENALADMGVRFGD